MGVGVVEPFDQYPDYNTTDGLCTTSTWISESLNQMFVLTTGLNGSGKAMRVFGTNGSAIRQRILFPATTQISGHFGFMYWSLSSIAAEILRFEDTSQNRQFGFAIGPNGYVTLLGENNAVLATGAFPLAMDTVYRFTIKADIAAGNCVVKVNGLPFISVTGVDLQDADATTMAAFATCTHVGTLGNAYGYDIDDLYVLCDEYIDVPELELTLYGPTADTADESWTPSSGVDSYALVDELPANTTDYVSSSTVGHKNIYDFANESRTAESILSVSLLMAAKKDESATRTLKQILKAGGVEYNGADKNQSTTWTFQKDHWRQNPNTVAAWAPGEINALQAGHAVVL